MEISINYYCIGAQKAGTSTLFELLNQHPELYAPSNKEAHFFDYDSKFENGLKWYYENFFADYQMEKLVGSFSPSYLFSEKVPKRIFESIPNPEKLKFIVILRNPAERAFSHYLMQVNNGKERLSFEEALNKELARMAKDDSTYLNFSYVNRGFYSKQIKHYLRFFKPEQFLFLSFENEILENIENTLIKVEDFLELPRFKYNFQVERNQFYRRIKPLFILSKRLKRFASSKNNGLLKSLSVILEKISRLGLKKPKLKSATRDKLIQEIFAKDMEELKELTQIDFKTAWSQKI